MNKYNKIKYILLFILGILIGLFVLNINNYNETIFPVVFGISIVIVWIVYYVIRVIWFKKNFECLKKYIILLILEDLFISCGLVLIYILKKNAIWEDLPFLILFPFLIPSIIIDIKLVK